MTNVTAEVNTTVTNITAAANATVATDVGNMDNNTLAQAAVNEITGLLNDSLLKAPETQGGSTPTAPAVDETKMNMTTSSTGDRSSTTSKAETAFTDPPDPAPASHLEPEVQSALEEAAEKQQLGHSRKLPQFRQKTLRMSTEARQKRKRLIDAAKNAVNQVAKLTGTDIERCSMKSKYFFLC